MWKKTACLMVIILAFYGELLLNDPSERVKMAGYNGLLNFYADLRLQEDDIKIPYNPGLRKMDMNLKSAIIKASLPNQEISYGQQMDRFLQSDGQVLVECSGLDGWHSSAEGQAYLPRLRDKAYRVVIFDGGHHLPTLGLAPDVIIVPVYKGYAVHGYMQDGLKISRLLRLLRDSHSQAILVTVSRWRLVKTKASLTGITRQVLSKLSFSEAQPEALQIACKPRMSKYHSQLYIYVNQDYVQNPVQLLENCRRLGLGDIKKINLAFDYAWISPEDADAYVRDIQRKLGRNVERMNEDLKVTDLIYRDM